MQGRRFLKLLQAAKHEQERKLEQIRSAIEIMSHGRGGHRTGKSMSKQAKKKLSLKMKRRWREWRKARKAVV
jgi:hypothetical protein